MSLQGGQLLKSNELTLAAAIVVVLVATVTLDSGHYYLRQPWDSFVDITRQSSLLGIIALGASVVIIAGGIDLSVGAVISCSGVVAASILALLAPEIMDPARAFDASGAETHLPQLVIAASIAGALLVGFLIGTLHAWLITVVGLPPFVATLATLVGLRSLARSICGAVTQSLLGGRSTQINIQDERFRYLAQSVWIPASVCAALAVIVWLVLTKTVAGRHLYALGGNEEAARLSGVRTDRMKWLAYVTSAVFASIAGVFQISQFSVAEPQTLGLGEELNAIAAAVVGGCSLQGGVGTVTGVMLGVIFLRAIIDGVAKVIKTGAETYEGLIVGIVVVVAVAVSQIRLAGRRGKQFFSGALGWFSIGALSLLAGALGMVMIGDTLAERMREAFGEQPGPMSRALLATLGEHPGASSLIFAAAFLVTVKLLEDHAQRRSS